MNAAKQQQASEFTIMNKMKPLAFSMIAGVVTCLILLVLMSVVMSVRDVPQAMINPMAIFSIAVGSFVSGFNCAKICRERGLLMGTICGIVMTFIVLFASFTVSDNGFGMLAVVKTMFIMFSAMLGGVLGVNVRGKRK